MINQKLIDEAIEKAFQVYFMKNEERLLKQWLEHLSELEDSTEFILKLQNSDKAFEEFARKDFEGLEPRDEDQWP